MTRTDRHAERRSRYSFARAEGNLAYFAAGGAIEARDQAITRESPGACRRHSMAAGIAFVAIGCRRGHGPLGDVAGPWSSVAETGGWPQMGAYHEREMPKG